jgi:hypothetical protein
MRAKPVVDAPFLFPLMDLPHELIALVVEFAYLEEFQTAVNLLSTCQLLQSLAEVHVYSYNLLRNAKEMGKLARALARRRNRLQHVRELKLYCDGLVSSKNDFDVALSTD